MLRRLRLDWHGRKGALLAQYGLLAVEQVDAHGVLNAFISTKAPKSATPWHRK